ncbi:hypothetical protein ADK59_18825 [Streptomyces sp. XY332]|nr:hypothetical protein ADK59_18825 [Streptomyces sp. XY332]
MPQLVAGPSGPYAPHSSILVAPGAGVAGATTGPLRHVDAATYPEADHIANSAVPRRTALHERAGSSEGWFGARSSTSSLGPATASDFLEPAVAAERAVEEA